MGLLTAPPACSHLQGLLTDPRPALTTGLLLHPTLTGALTDPRPAHTTGVFTASRPAHTGLLTAPPTCPPRGCSLTPDLLTPCSHCTCSHHRLSLTPTCSHHGAPHWPPTCSHHGAPHCTPRPAPPQGSSVPPDLPPWGSSLPPTCSHHRAPPAP
ncbi:actin cytoskeleton-regulatory complex protein PAN1-like [Homarus americanus]|uniref:actin cytoskeleton-regulatory complex protein PAN1-like n=1 Tax=Homarus americanus TaxID=6706 RepID=UPI001C4740A2|nr:actin cytoskeleton-regulatory complex protein PAN1-like [Homarus americanus]